MEKQLSIPMRAVAKTPINEAVAGKELSEHITILTNELEEISQQLEEISQQLPDRAQ